MLNLMLIATLQLTSVITPDQERLGQRLASLSGIATIAPKMIEKDLQDLSLEDKSLSPAERLQLMSIGHAEANRNLDRLITTLGHAYASRLTVAELHQLVSDAESPAAVHRRSIEPSAMMETMSKLGEMDLKKSVARTFCRETAKLCDR